MAPKISVIIPIYNVEKYLRRCLDSVGKQSFKDIEIICINDGSPDNCLKILDEYAARDKRIVVINKKNAGVSAARNDGIKIAHGKYIHFLDADDFIDSDYYQKMYDAAIKNSADIVCSGFVTNTKYARDLKYTYDFVADDLNAKIRRSYAFTDGYVWRYLFDRRFLVKNKLLFDTKMISQEDVIFVLNAIAVSNRISFVSGTYYHYMFNDMSALNTRDAAHHKKVKMQYKIGKEYKRDFARKYDIMGLWIWRKILRRI